MDSRRHGLLLIVGGVAPIVAGLAVGTPLLGNLYDLVTGAGYTIPAESSVFTFRATVMNDGSGEWWMCGEDGRNYYGVPESGAAYLVFPRARAGECPGFQARDVKTWCPALVKPGAQSS